jgi:uncharacterized protein (DUF302 family)
VQKHDYGLKVTTTADVEQADAAVREALAVEGFGVLTEIDVAETLRAKLGVEMAPYRILGACRPHLAAQALTAEPDIGLLLPCNVVVYAEGDHTVVAALDPLMMTGVTGNESLTEIAQDARARLERALLAVGA